MRLFDSFYAKEEKREGKIACCPRAGQSGIFYGCFRSLCRRWVPLWSNMQMLPKTVPQNGLQMAYLTETSVNYAAESVVCGMVCGRFRELSRGWVCERSILRMLPKTMP